jgi:DNA-binding NarL/FixJ family response regulator
MKRTLFAIVVVAAALVFASADEGLQTARVVSIKKHPQGRNRLLGRAIFDGHPVYDVTLESADLVREAFSFGAWGYVRKVNAGHELLIAVESVLQGKQFVGGGLDGIGELRAVERPVPRDGLTA